MRTRWLTVLVVTAVALVGTACSSGGSSEGAPATDAPASTDAAAGDGQTASDGPTASSEDRPIALTDAEVKGLDYGAAFLTLDEVNQVVAAVTGDLAPDAEEPTFDLAGKSAVSVCGFFPKEDETALAGEGTEYNDGKSVTVTMSTAGYELATADKVWDEMVAGGDLDGDCTDYTQKDGDKIDVSSSHDLQAAWDVPDVQDRVVGEDVVVVQFRDEQDYTVADFLYRRGQVIAKIRVGYPKGLLDEIASAHLAAHFFDNVAESYAA